MGIRVEKQHHEVATAGQAEIDMRFQPLVKMADWLTWYKYIVQERRGAPWDDGDLHAQADLRRQRSGMHTHQSIWKGDTPLFAGNGYAGMSELAMHYIAGILHHAPTLAAFTYPGTNSYRRLVPGFEAPINLAYSSAATARPRCEYRCIRRRPRPSESKYDSPTRPAIRISRSPRC